MSSNKMHKLVKNFKYDGQLVIYAQSSHLTKTAEERSKCRLMTCTQKHVISYAK